MHRSFEIYISAITGIQNVPCDHHATKPNFSKIAVSVYSHVVVAAAKYVMPFLVTFLFD